MEYSFIIPVYNCEPFLCSCVAHVCEITQVSYEVILINDGSTDQSGHLCDTLSKEYPQVKVYHQKNAGASSARNLGLEKASGRKILFVDADDTFDTSLMEKILLDPRIDQSDLTIFGMTFDYFHNGICYRRDPLYFYIDDILLPNGWGNHFTQLFADNALSPVWNKIYKREIIDSHFLRFDTALFLYEDFEFVLRYLQHCNSIWNIPQAIYHYRQTEDEGNAGRRLTRIHSIPDYLQSIEFALAALPESVPQNSREQVLLQLHLTLAKEKIAVSDTKQIRQICREYTRWYLKKPFPIIEDGLHRLLMDGKAHTLYLQAKKSAIRHALAVRVKTCLKQLGIRE